MSKGLTNITLVVHDFGGPVGLDFAIRYPEKIKNLIILNSWLWSSERDPDFIKIKGFLKSPLLPFLYKQLNFSPKFILPKAFGERKIAKTILTHFVRPFENSDQRNGALAFAKSLLNDQDWFEELWQHKAPVEDKPTLFIWGMKDPIVKPHSLLKFESGFRKSKTVRIEHAGHFPQEEFPFEVANAIRAFLKG